MKKPFKHRACMKSRAGKCRRKMKDDKGQIYAETIVQTKISVKFKYIAAQRLTI